MHAHVTAAAGRGLARSLKQLSGAWWVAQHDEYGEAARRSTAAFETCFPGSKAKEALAFCHTQVHLTSDNTLGEWRGHRPYVLAGLSGRN